MNKEIITLNAAIQTVRYELIKLVNKPGGRNAVRRVFFNSKLKMLLAKREALLGATA